MNALSQTEFDKVQVVICGQDPYQTLSFPIGLAFAVNRGVEIPKSLQNIFAELKSDVGVETPKHGDLTNLAKQGVLLLNNSLTVLEGTSNSHVSCFI